MGLISWNFFNNSATGANISLNNAPYEWEFDYKNTTGGTTYDPDANGGMVAGRDSWRYWLITQLSGTTPLGLYVTHYNGNLEIRRKYDVPATQYQSLYSIPLPNTNHTYQIRIVRSVTGYFNVYILDRNTGVTTSSLNLNLNYYSTYNLSYLEATSADPDRFQWDNFNFYRVKLDYVSIPATSTNGITTTLYPGIVNAVPYAINVNVRGDVGIGRFVINFSGNASNLGQSLFTTGTIYKTTGNVFTVANGTKLNDVNVNGVNTQQTDFSGLNPPEYYYNAGNTDGTTVNVVNYFFVAQGRDPFYNGYPTSISYSISTSADDNYSQFFQLKSPYTSSSSNSASTPTVAGNVWDWTGLDQSWTVANCWKRNTKASTDRPSASTDIVRIGVVPYVSGTFQPQNSTGSDIAVGTVIIGKYGSGSSSAPAEVTLDLSSKNLTVSNGFMIEAGAKAVLRNGSASTSMVKVSGNSSIASTGSLNFQSGSNPINFQNLSGTFTLKSDASGTASIGTIPTNSQISGTFVTERHVTGGADYNTTRKNYTYRNYRIMSSPVSTSTESVGKVSTLTYMAKSAIVTGATGGYTSSGNATIYLFNENFAGTSASFSSSNFRPVTDISGPALTVGGTTNYLYAGTGFLFYYRGNKVNNLTAKTTSPYVAPESVVFSNTGTINQGPVAIKDFNGNTTWTKHTTATSAFQGLTLVGNPYPSAIDWEKTAGFETTGAISNTIWGFNYITNQYEAYTRGTGGSTNGNIIMSGQAFFVKNTGADGSTASLTINENAKTSSQSTLASNLLLGIPDGSQLPVSRIKLQLYLDSLNYDNVLIALRDGADEKFNEQEDGVDIGGSGAYESMSVLSSDEVYLANNAIPYPTQQAKSVPVYVSATSSGIYQIKKTGIENLPKLYDVWLMDSFTKDSLDLRANQTYNFNIDRANPATFGKDRFKVIIRQNPAMGLKLLGFDASKVTTGVQLAWTTENESNYTNYTIERTTDGGKTFDIIGSLHSSDLGKYLLIDKAPVMGLNQYRLKQDDINGTISYSDIVKVMYANKSDNALATISVYPNPTASTINIAIPSTQNETSYSIRVTNGTGITVRSATTNTANWQGNVSDLMPGTYFVQITNNSTKAMIGNSKFIKL